MIQTISYQFSKSDSIWSSKSEVTTNLLRIHKNRKFIKFGCLPQVGRRTWEQRNAPCKLRGAGIETLASLGSLQKHQVSRKPSKMKVFGVLKFGPFSFPTKSKCLGSKEGKTASNLSQGRLKFFASKELLPDVASLPLCNNPRIVITTLFQVAMYQFSGWVTKGTVPFNMGSSCRKCSKWGPQ